MWSPLPHPGGLSIGLQHQAIVTSDDPDIQVADTVAMMAEYVREDWRSPEIERDAQLAVPLGTDPIAGVFNWVKQRLQFQTDERTSIPLVPLYEHPIVEVLIRPRDVALGFPTGDCDDFAMYAAALLRQHGIESNFVTISADQASPSSFSHVYLAAYRDGERIPFDTSHGSYPGWEAPNLGRLKEWPIFGTPWLLLGVAGAGLLLLIRKGRKDLQ